MSVELSVIGNALNGDTVGVTDANEAKVDNPVGIHRASLLGDAYVINMRDAAPTANEISLYIKNTNPLRDFVVSSIESYGNDADVEWILSTMDTVTATGTAIDAVNLNLGSVVAPGLDIHGGAAGVGGTAAIATGTIKQWLNGVANTTEYIDLEDSLILPYGTAIGFEYQAGTGGVAILCVRGYFQDKVN